MRIIIVGCGKVGYRVAENLSAENHDITVIDTLETAINNASNSLDVLCIKGNGASIRVLKSAGVERADLIIAATGRDEVNMVCCLTAKKLGAKYTVARIRDYEYAAELSELSEKMDIDMVINPESATALQISRLVRFPQAFDVESFFGGKVELAGFRVSENDMIVGEPLHQVRKKLGNLSILFCAVERNGETIIPNGSTVLQSGDKVYVISEVTTIVKFFRAIGKITQKIKNVFMIGGSRISIYLCQLLEAMNISVTLVERDHKKCVALCEILPNTLVINGDGTDHELLTTENIKNAGAFIALTSDDEDNLITSIYVKQLGVPKVIAKISRQNYYTILNGLALDTAINPPAITAYAMLRSVRALSNAHGSQMQALYKIANESAEAMEFIIGKNTKNLRTPLKDLQHNLRDGILIAAINRNHKFFIPGGNDYLDIGDSVIIIAKGLIISDINDIYNS